MTKKTLQAEIRKLSGRKVKTLRTAGILPANIYGKKIESTSIQVDTKAFQTLYKEVGETGLFDLMVGTTARPVLVHGLQVNPKTDELLHVDFLEVDLKVKVTAEVPIELVGESPVAKQGIGTIVQQLNDVEVEALPADLPEKFEVNIENLTEVDQAVYVKDIKVDTSKVEIKSDPEIIVVKVEPPQKEEVIETPIVAVGADGAVPVEASSPEGLQPGGVQSESSKDSNPQK